MEVEEAVSHVDAAGLRVIYRREGRGGREGGRWEMMLLL